MSIVESIDKGILESGLPSVSERYYEHRYCKSIPDVGDNLYHRVSFHTNKICLLSLADNHPVIKLDKRIVRVNFDVGDNIDRLKNVTSGKGKRGAQKLNPESKICIIETEDEQYPVYSCVKGKLIEINENLVERPDLLKRHPTSSGYIALILPILNNYVSSKESMLSTDEYNALYNKTS